MSRHREDTYTAATAEADFSRAIRICEALWGDKAFTRTNNGAWRKQFIAGVYDAQMVAVHCIGLTDPVKATNLRDQADDVMLALFSDPNYVRACTVGTNTSSSVFTRISQLIERLRDII
jgi:hypothetical protein